MWGLCACAGEIRNARGRGEDLDALESGRGVVGSPRIMCVSGEEEGGDWLVGYLYRRFVFCCCFFKLAFLKTTQSDNIVMGG